MRVRAVILEGGRGTRLGGVDKGALVVAGRTIRSRQLEALRPVTDAVLRVGAPTIDGGDGVPAVADMVPDRGPLGGLATALAAAPGETLLVLACDLPHVTTGFLSCLVRIAAEAPEADAVVPKTERGYHPLCAVYRPSARDAVERGLAAGHLAMTRLLSDLRVRVVREDELEEFGGSRWLLANVNTPSDLAEVQESAPADHRR